MLAYYAGFVPCEGKISVTFPDVPGCITFGDDIRAAFAYAIEALALHLEALAEDGLNIPEPSGASEAWEKIRAEQADMGLGELPPDTQLLLVPAPEVAARPKKIMVSFRPPALEMIDRKAAALGMTRSGFLARAAGAFQVEAAH